MILRVTWGKIVPGKWEKFETLWNTLAEETKDEKGLLARWLLLDKEQQDTGYSLTLWNSAEDMTNYKKPRPAYEAMNECFTGQFVTTECEVRGAHLSGLKALLAD